MCSLDHRFSIAFHETQFPDSMPAGKHDTLQRSGWQVPWVPVSSSGRFKFAGPCGLGIAMSSHSLATGSGSSATLLRGLSLAAQPLSSVLRLKEEPADDEERAMLAEMKDGVEFGASLGVWWALDISV